MVMVPSGQKLFARRPIQAGAASGGRTGPRRSFVLGTVCGVLLVIGFGLLVNHTRAADVIVSPLVRSDTAGPVDAIVVLGAGLVGDCVLNVNSLRRVILGARLWRAGRAPILFFTGGVPPGLSCSVSSVMAGFAETLGVPRDRIEIEGSSRSTWENAERSAPLLRRLGAARLLIVTDCLHMSRATGVFAHFGFIAGRASVPVYEGHLDNVSMLEAGLREYVALGYYWCRGRLRHVAPIPSAED